MSIGDLMLPSVLLVIKEPLSVNMKIEIIR
jgi:hypothetical protein